MTKKLLSLTLVLALCLAPVSPALAAEDGAAPSFEGQTDAAYTVKQLTDFKYDDVGSFQGGYAPVEADHLWGFVDMTGREVLSPQFDAAGYAGSYDHGISVAKNDADGNPQWGIVDPSGSPRVALQYDSIGNCENGCPIPVQKDGKWFFVDETGETAFAGEFAYLPSEIPSFSYVSPERSVCFLMQDGKWGAIDQAGRVVIPFAYTYPQDDAPYVDYDADVVFLQNDQGKWGALDMNGQTVIPFAYDREGNHAPFFEPHAQDSGAFCWLQKDGKWGCFQAGVEEPVVDFLYDDYLDGFSQEGLAAVSLVDETTGARKWGYVDATGQVVVDIKYFSAGVFFAGRAQVQTKIGGPLLLVDATGKEIIPAKNYFLIGPFSQGLADAVYREDGLDKTDYIRPDGTVAFTTHYQRADTFHEGLARVGVQAPGSRDILYGFINNKGEEVIPCTFQNAGYRFENGHALVVDQDGKMGVIDTKGNFVLPCVLDGTRQFIPLYHPFFEVTVNGKHGLIDNQGRVVLPWAYADVTTPAQGRAAAKNAQGKWAIFSVSGGVNQDWENNTLTLSETAIYVNKGKTAAVTADVNGYGNMNIYAISADAQVASVSVNHRAVTVKGEAEGKTSVYVILSDTDVTLEDAKANSSMQWVQVTVTKPSGGNTPGGNTPGGNTPGGNTPGGGSMGGGSTPAPAPETKPASQLFTDVEKNSWYEKGVGYVVENKLFQGVGNGAFKPMDTMTRGMLMTVLARKAGVDTTTGATWYEAGMNWAKETGVSDGTHPEAAVTREQIVTMLWRYTKSPKSAGKLDAFPDGASASPWALDALKWAVENGILTGKNGNRLAPQDNATRAEVAVLLERLWNVKA